MNSERPNSRNCFRFNTRNAIAQTTINPNNHWFRGRIIIINIVDRQIQIRIQRRRIVVLFLLRFVCFLFFVCCWIGYCRSTSRLENSSTLFLFFSRALSLSLFRSLSPSRQKQTTKEARTPRQIRQTVWGDDNQPTRTIGMDRSKESFTLLFLPLLQYYKQRKGTQKRWEVWSNKDWFHVIIVHRRKRFSTTIKITKKEDGALEFSYVVVRRYLLPPHQPPLLFTSSVQS